MTAAALFAAALAFTPAEAEGAWSVASTLVDRHVPRDAGTPGALAAARYLAEVSGGRIDAFETGGTEYRNVVAERETRKGGEWIVFVSHYDTKPGTRCPGANDGASTSGLLVALAKSSALPPSFNYMFLWTDGEECRGARYTAEDGLAGSRHAAEELARGGRKVRAVICLDMLGDADLRVCAPPNCSASLRDVAFAAARRTRTRAGRMFSMLTDDHAPFMERGFEAVALIDFDYGPRGGSWWHTPEDTMDKVSRDSLLAAGRLAVEMARILAEGGAQ